MKRFILLVSFCLSLASCKTRTAPTDSNETPSPQIQQGASLDQINANLIRLNANVKSDVHSLVIYGGEQSLGLTGYGSYFADILEALGLGRVAKLAGYEKHPVRELSEGLSKVHTYKVDEEALSGIKNINDAKDLHNELRRNNSSDDVIIICKEDQKLPKSSDVAYQKISIFKGYTKYRGFSRIGKDLSNLIEGQNRVINLKRIGELGGEGKNGIFTDIIRNAPDGVSFESMKMGLYRFEKLEPESLDYIVTRVSASEQSWGVEFSYSSAKKGGALWDQLYKSAKDENIHRKREMNEDWVRAISQGLERDITIGENRVRIEFDNGSGSIRLLEPSETELIFREQFHWESPVQEGYYWPPRIEAVRGNLVVQAEFSRLAIEKYSLQKINWVDSLAITNPQVSKAKKDQVALILFPTSELDFNGAFARPPAAMLDSLVCCYGTVKMVRVSNIADIKIELEKIGSKKIGALVLGGHGSPNSIGLKNRKGKEKILSEELAEEFSSIRFDDYLVDGAPVYPYACSIGDVGTKDNFLETLTTVIPDRDIEGAMFRGSPDKIREFSDSVKGNFAYRIRGVGDIPFSLSRNSSTTHYFGPVREKIHESLVKNLENPEHKFLYYDPELEKIVEFEASQIKKLIISINRFQDYYSSGVLSLFATRLKVGNDGLHVINPNENLLKFFNHNNIDGVAEVHFIDWFENAPNYWIKKSDRGTLVLNGRELRAAVDDGNLDKLRDLLENQKMTDPEGYSLIAAVQGDNEEAFKLLLQQGAGDSGGFALRAAVMEIVTIRTYRRFSGFDYLDALLKNGAKDPNGIALAAAAKYGRLSMVENLLRHGSKDTEGKALAEAIDHLEMMNGKEVFEALMNSPGLKDPDGRTLEKAVVKNDLEILNTLLSKGIKDTHGRAMSTARMFENTKMIEVLEKASSK